MKPKGKDSLIFTYGARADPASGIYFNIIYACL